MNMKRILLLYPKRTVIKIKCCVRLPRYELDGAMMEIWGFDANLFWFVDRA